MREYDFTRLKVYERALDFVEAGDGIAAGFPDGRAYLADQLRRASASMPLNIAEGAGEFTPKEKARFYRIARRSATECASLLRTAARLRLAPPAALDSADAILFEIVSMLTRMIKNLQNA